jgi:hypothetical protein
MRAGKGFDRRRSHASMEARVQALEQSRQESALLAVENLRNVEARNWSLEHSERSTDNRLQPLEEQQQRVGVVLIALTAFLAGLAVGVF